MKICPPKAPSEGAEFEGEIRGVGAGTLNSKGAAVGIP